MGRMLHHIPIDTISYAVKGLYFSNHIIRFLVPQYLGNCFGFKLHLIPLAFWF